MLISTFYVFFKILVRIFWIQRIKMFSRLVFWRSKTHGKLVHFQHFNMLVFSYIYSFICLFVIRWELCPEQRTYFEYTQHLNGYLREEYHSLNVRIFQQQQIISCFHRFFINESFCFLSLLFINQIRILSLKICCIKVDIIRLTICRSVQ